MLFVNAGAVLSLVAFLAPTALGAVVPQSDGLYTIANVATGRVISHYRTENPVVGDPVITSLAIVSESQDASTWRVSYLIYEGPGKFNFITLTGTGTNDDIYVGSSEGDGLVTQSGPTVFQLIRVPGAVDPAYWLLLGGQDSLVVTGYNRALQLTLETLNTTNTLQAWQFYVPVVSAANETKTGAV
ncbi:hypothetical protein AURDEDRAFT_167597 [Auricularia subglabra TFB-10046 SS5]|nr:hypothetical protein AURDEDRAFT_167597 [Auricularia subglabra TFB-10046 SS5]